MNKPGFGNKGDSAEAGQAGFKQRAIDDSAEAGPALKGDAVLNINGVPTFTCPDVVAWELPFAAFFGGYLPVMLSMLRYASVPIIHLLLELRDRKPHQPNLLLKTGCCTRCPWDPSRQLLQLQPPQPVLTTWYRCITYSKHASCQAR